MKLKLLCAALLINLMPLPSFAENTYNFYFDEGKKKEEKGSEVQSVTPSPLREQKETIRSSFPLNIMSFSDTYFSIGGGLEQYGTEVKTRWPNISSSINYYWRHEDERPAAIQLNVKFLPLIGFETSYGVNHAALQSLRYAAYLETTLFKYLSLRVLGGAATIEGHTSPYAGIGGSLRLFKYILLSASYNAFRSSHSIGKDKNLRSDFMTFNAGIDLLQFSNLF